MARPSFTADTALSTLTALISKADYLKFRGDLLAVMRCRRTRSAATSAMLLTDDLLQQAHPELLAAVRNATRYWKNKTGRIIYSPSLIGLQLRYLAQDFSEFKSREGTMVAVTDVYAVMWCTEADGEHLRLMTTCLSIALETQETPTVPPIPTTPFITDTVEQEIDVDLGWLDTQFPDWRVRLQVAGGLDLDTKPFIDYVFERSLAVSAAVNLPNIQLVPL